MSDQPAMTPRIAYQRMIVSIAVLVIGTALLFFVAGDRFYNWAIINPAMIVSWMFGLWLAWKGFGFMGGWLHAKIAAVLVLSGVHGYLSAAVRRFANDENTKSARHWRIVNEVPTILMIVIVILVIVKPF